MNVNQIVFACALVAAASVLAAEQIEIPDWESSVQFRLVTSQQPIRPGDSFEVALVAEIEEGYHLYGPEEPYPSRTEVSVSGENLEVGDPSYPPVETRESRPKPMKPRAALRTAPPSSPAGTRNS